MKTYLFKIYSPSGTYITTWNDASFGGFSKSINGGLGQVDVALARKFDDFGEGEDIKHNNEVQIWLSDNDTPSEGIKIYSGYISAIKPWIDGSKEGVSVVLLGYVSKLSQDIYRELYTCLDFVADNSDTVTVADNAAHDVTDALTIECWFKTTTVVSDHIGLVLHDLSDPKYELHIYGNGVVSNELHFFVKPGAGLEGVIAYRASGWNDGNWHYMCGVWEKPYLRLYVDGKLQAEYNASNANIVAGNEGLTIGRMDSNYFNGQMMNVRVSNKVRAPDEISMNWKKGQKLEVDPTVMGCFHFDEGTGTVVVDENGIQNGVVDGADWLTDQEARSTINKEDTDPSTMLKNIIDQYRLNNANAKINHLIT